MSRRFVLALLLIAVPIAAEQIVVIPAVSDNTPGRNGSVWATEVQIIKVDPLDSLTVRRVWVCVPEGGFEEEPGSARTWDMGGTLARDRLLTLVGSDLLADSGSNVGAVALEIQGGEAIINARIADVSRGMWSGWTPFGQGQRVPALEDPLEGPSILPWVGGCRNDPCSSHDPAAWDYFRDNVGIVNPNPMPLTVSGAAIGFGPDATDEPVELELPEGTRETFERVVPAFGWLQFRWVAAERYGFNQWGMPRIPIAGFVVTLEPDQEIPYFAYASTVFSPDPDSSVPIFNDPMFIPAHEGFIEPYSRD
ncbi:MAG: hypothetical protein V2I67_00845 [Thermoanaerobaculales bacterium]|jgi:hypothetical protein|nr:hypothetical protein [Thermoanaerobaculales bacterium]